MRSYSPWPGPCVVSQTRAAASSGENLCTSLPNEAQSAIQGKETNHESQRTDGEGRHHLRGHSPARRDREADVGARHWLHPRHLVRKRRLRRRHHRSRRLPRAAIGSKARSFRSLTRRGSTLMRECDRLHRARKARGGADECSELESPERVEPARADAAEAADEEAFRVSARVSA